MPDDRVHRHLIVRIRELAIERGTSPSAVATLGGVSTAQISRLMNGKQSPTLATLIKLAAALGVSTRDLLPPKDD